MPPVVITDSDTLIDEWEALREYVQETCEDGEKTYQIMIRMKSFLTKAVNYARENANV